MNQNLKFAIDRNRELIAELQAQREGVLNELHYAKREAARLSTAVERFDTEIESLGEAIVVLEQGSSAPARRAKPKAKPATGPTIQTV